MIYPSMASLLKKVDSRYTLVIATSKRARMLTDGAEKLTKKNSPKDVTIAIHEISEGKVGYHKIIRHDQPEHKGDTGYVTTDPNSTAERPELNLSDDQ